MEGNTTSGGAGQPVTQNTNTQMNNGWQSGVGSANVAGQQSVAGSANPAMGGGATGVGQQSMAQSANPAVGQQPVAQGAGPAAGGAVPGVGQQSPIGSANQQSVAASANAVSGVEVAGRFYSDAELDNMSEDQVLDLFVEKMIEDKGMGGLEADLKQEIRSDLKERLIFQINRAIIAALPDDKYEELDKSLDDQTATAESLNQIVADSGVNVAGITQQTMEEFRAVYLSTNANDVRG